MENLKIEVSRYAGGGWIAEFEDKNKNLISAKAKKRLKAIGKLVVKLGTYYPDDIKIEFNKDFYVCGG